MKYTNNGAICSWLCQLLRTDFEKLGHAQMVLASSRGSLCQFSAHAEAEYGIIDSMRGMRKFIRARSGGRLLALGVAYSLAIQALLASTGLGMFAASASGQADYVICSFAPDSGTHVPGPIAMGRNPIPSPSAHSASSRLRAPVSSRPSVRRPRTRLMPGCALPGYSPAMLPMEPFVPAFSPHSWRSARSPNVFRLTLELVPRRVKSSLMRSRRTLCAFSRISLARQC